VAITGVARIELGSRWRRTLGALGGFRRLRGMSEKTPKKKNRVR
jgi:hypothetical protein